MKVSIRSCVLCRTKAEQGSLIRIVLSKAGEVKVRASSYAEGRGAYLCNKCTKDEPINIMRALRRALKYNVPDTILNEIQQVKTE